MVGYEELVKDPIVREKEALALWQQQDTFAKCLEQTKGGQRYVFYEGPPTANGKPHLGHLMPRVYKDLFPRYKTMKGYYVARKGGWDTHGLPVELEVEKEIGVNSKPEIEAYGVERFVERCKESVWRYKADWESMIERMGFWMDEENAYVTYTDDYIESVWWELAQMFDRGLLYQGHKVLPFCPRCGTGLSSHEVAQGYKTVKDPSISVRMLITGDEECCYKQELPGRTALLTWTTTPWTMPANVALAVAPRATYAEVEQNGERLILAKALLGQALEGDYKVVRQFLGKELVGLRYEPPYVLVDDAAAYSVHAAEFVNMKEGTGIVHVAPAYGEDDYQLAQEEGLPFFHPVNLSGEFTKEFPLCSGTSVKEADPLLIDDLTKRNLLYRLVLYEHEYPFCWRCDTPLLYYAMDSWYIKTTAVKDQLNTNNRQINWYPAHVGSGRLGDFLANLKDWALSRDRYWGTPLNLWTCESCGKVIAVASRAQLVELAVDRKLASTVEFHRPYIDAVELVCGECGNKMRRVPNVIDAWFDSGSMHTAQWHYPFENTDEFKNSFPADFICEAVDQTRGWFYTLLATSTIIHGEAPFRNCIATGFGLDESGLKMSKSKGNVVDPWELIDVYGADCLRWYLYSSSAPWKSKRLGEANVKEPLYRFLDTLCNTYNFFALYASIDSFDPMKHQATRQQLNVLDKWILSRLSSTVNKVTTGLDNYDVVSATEAIESLLEELSNWYVRSSRRRFWKGGMEGDKIAAYTTLYRVLIDLVRILAPFVPFITEAIYQRLRTVGDPESVHLCSYPDSEDGQVDHDLELAMAAARQVVSLGHQARNRARIKVRQPLHRILVETNLPLGEEICWLIEKELNVGTIEQVPTVEAYLKKTPNPNFRTLGPRLGAKAQMAAAWLKTQSPESLVKAFDAGTSIDAQIDGEDVEIREEDVSFEAVPPKGFLLAEEGEVRLLVDANLSDKLREQGLMREIMHSVQLLRKEAGFAVSDRIIVGYETDRRLTDLITEHRETIAAEILAVDLVSRLEQDYEYTEELTIGASTIIFGLSRSDKSE